MTDGDAVTLAPHHPRRKAQHMDVYVLFTFAVRLILHGSEDWIFTVEETSAHDAGERALAWAWNRLGWPIDQIEVAEVEQA